MLSVDYMKIKNCKVIFLRLNISIVLKKILKSNKKFFEFVFNICANFFMPQNFFAKRIV